MSEDDSGEVHEVYRKEGVRLEEEMVPQLYKYFYGAGTMEFIEGVHAFDKAHVVMLTEQGVIPEDAGVQILEGLRRLEDEGMVETRERLGGHLHTGEAFLTTILDEDVAGRIHAGRSSGDLGAVGTRWRNREDLLTVMERVNEFRGALLEKAEEHAETVMPGYTHMQHAQPVTFGHYLMSFEHALERDFERLETAYKHTNISPAGAAIMTGSSYNIDRERTAELLGFDGLYTNTMDAILNSDWGLGTHGAYTSLYSTVAKLNEDLNLFMSHEYGFVDLADRYCGTSSIMPQKKNPYLTEFAVGTAGEIYGGSVNSLVRAKASHGRLDSIRGGYFGLTDSFEMVEVVLSMMPTAIETLGVDEERMAEAAAENWAQATDVADVMVQEEGLPFRAAHQITGVLVRMANERGLAPMEVTTELLDEAAEQVRGEPLGLDPDALDRALDPARCVRARTVIGGPNPDLVREDIERGRDALAADGEGLRERRGRLDEAAEELEAAIDGLVA